MFLTLATGLGYAYPPEQSYALAEWCGVKRDREALAFVCHPYHRGGVTRWMVDASVEWRRKGGEAWFVVPSPQVETLAASKRPKVRHLFEPIGPMNLPRIFAPDVGSEFELGTSVYRSLVYARATQQHVPSGVPLIISDDAAVWRAAARLGPRNPVIGVLHADDEWYYDLAQRFHAHVCAFVAVSRRIAEELAARHPKLDAPIVTIPCGIVVPPPPTGLRMQNTLLRLVWVGRVDERQKRVSDLGKIAHGLAELGIEFQLDVVGDGADAWRITHELPESTRARIHLHGWRSPEDVHSLLGLADIILLPSNFEGMPIAAMEALANGCAVVASDSAGVAEYARAATAVDCLWIYRCGDVSGALTAIRAAARIPPSRRQERAHALASEEFSIRACMDRYATLVEKVPCQATRNRVGVGAIGIARAVSRGVAALRRHRHGLGKRDADS